MERFQGTVTEVWDLEGYGYVETGGGESIYFDRSGVSRGHFARLVVGAEVSFEREETDSGPRARRLRVVRSAGVAFASRFPR